MLPFAILGILALTGGAWWWKNKSSTSGGTTHIAVAGGAGVVPVDTSTPVGMHLSKMTFNPDGTFATTTENMGHLNDIMAYMKANKLLAIKVPTAVAKWLAAHGVDPKRLV